MIRIVISGDQHCSQYSSIVRSRGKVYSTRLENLIESITWLEELSKAYSCDLEVFLGDFFDKPELNAEELTALNSIIWNNTKKYFIVGNHEMGIQDLSFSSAHLFNLIPNSEVIDKPRLLKDYNLELCFLPYILEDRRKNISDYFGDKNNSTRVIFSHNDIAGLQLGQWLSQTGFDINEIKESCDFYFNGHIHNSEVFDNRIFNVGNLTGQNFSEDGFKYKHDAYILEIDETTGKVLSVEKFENPHALYFYKLDFSNGYSSFDNISDNNCVLSIKCKEKDLEKIKSELPKNTIAKKFIIVPEMVGESESNIEDLSVDHLEKFKEFIIDQLGNTDVVNSELAEVVK